ncbi:uncharacterized protein LOC125003678 isoform X2 [Mugil cephalus]|uniref:uncharacterized protein LOC125003678 isoform X2 n=1 Tax=Mugil cephalus TaxID=48193 RepID=UPI001FB85B9E|nr:uncharacterized protein LOC125003678 isoform X2 [Mugil cephalus]
MRSFTALTALLLCSLSWISVSASESGIVNVQPGEEVTLMCSNNSVGPTYTFWSKLINTTKVRCISSMYGFSGDPKYCTGFENGKFHMSSNISDVFLKIKQVDSSDSGLYFCGYYEKGHTIMDVKHVNVQGDGESRDGNEDFAKSGEPNDVTELTSMILAALAFILIIIIIGLLVKVRKLQKAVDENPNPEEIHYAALNFNKKSRTTHRCPPERQLEPNVVYAATR